MEEGTGNRNDRKPGVFISGEYVNLTVLTEEDVLNSNWYDWFNDEETSVFMQKHYFPNTREMQLEFFRREIIGSRFKLQLGIKDVLKKEPIFGVVSLNNIDHLNRKAEISIIIGEKKYRNVKYSLEACKLIILHGFNTLNLHRIYGGTLMNEWAELLCRRLKFEREGILKQDVFKNGDYRDIYLVALLRERWREIGMIQEKRV